MAGIMDASRRIGALAAIDGLALVAGGGQE